MYVVTSRTVRIIQRNPVLGKKERWGREREREKKNQSITLTKPKTKQKEKRI